MRLGYVHLPRFPVQRRVLEQPSLARTPLVLHADERGVQRVRFASRAAMEQGVAPGQTVAAAQALVPELGKRGYDEALEATALLSLGEALLPLAPGFQLDAPEGLWLDASAAPLVGGEEKWAQRVVAACHALGLRARCVVGSERFTAQAVARFGKEASQVLERGGGDALVALPLHALEEGWLGPGGAASFRGLGLSTLGEVAALSSGALVARYGAMGRWAARLCRGEDDSRFVATGLPEVLEEACELDWPAEHLEPLLFAVKTVVDRLCARLQGRQRAAVQLSVFLSLEGTSSKASDTRAVPLRLARPSSQSRLLLELIRHQLTDLTVEQPIAEVRVLVEEACADPGRQLMLGQGAAGEAELEVVLARLQSALGADALFCAEPLPQHRPEEAWARRDFRPPDAGRVSDVWGVMEAGWVLGEAPPALRREEAAGEGAAVGRAGTPGGVTAPLRGLEAASDGAASDGAVVSEEAAASGEVAASGDAAAPATLDALVTQAMARVDRRAPKPKPPPRPVLDAAALTARPPRLFREPARLEVEVDAEGALTAVRLLGRRRPVAGLWGPERLSGAWWAQAAFARDYYRLLLTGVGVLWVFRDGQDGRFYAQGVFD